MRRYEKITIFFVIVLFGLQLLPDYTGKSSLFLFAILFLSLSYFIGGYWLFNSKDNKKYFLPITAGIAFSVSLFPLPFLIRVRHDYIFYLLPILNGLLFLGLAIYLIANRKTGNITIRVKSIFIRASIILIITSVFTYMPISFKPHRKLVMALNLGNEHLTNNLLMIDYSEECETALNMGDCDKAIEYAEKANSSGKIWLEIKENQNDLYPISRTYSNLYSAYKCKADLEYDNNKFDDALADYEKAHQNLIACNHRLKNWDEEKSWSLNNIAFCYYYLKQPYIADSIFYLAIENYKSINDTEDNGLAKLYSNLALSLSDGSNFEYSNIYYQGANAILMNDTINIYNRKDLNRNYEGLAKNYLQQDSLHESLYFVRRAMEFANKDEAEYCSNLYIYSSGLYRLNEYQKTDSILKTCLHCYENKPKNDKHIAQCNLSLSQVNISLAKYDDAQKYVNTGIEIITKNSGLNSYRYASFLKVLAHLNKILGDYSTSEKQYNKVIEIYTRELGIGNNKLPAVLSGLSELEIILSNFISAKQHSDSSLSIASNYLPLTYPSTTNFLITAAYVDYCLGSYFSADTLYKKVIIINKNYGLNSDASTAIALNGLGLIETAKNNFTKADSFFLQSLELHKKIFSENNPSTAIVYLNYGTLLTRMGKLLDAEEKINKALSIDNQFFKNDHDIFADIFVALGDLAKKKGQKDIAYEHYKKALNIYKKKFDDEHWKVVETKRKLK